MLQEPAPGHGREDIPPGASGGPVPGPRGGSTGVAARAAGGYAAFEQGCPLDGEIASAALAVVLDELAGPDRRPAGASDDAVIGMIAAADRLAAWCESVKLGLVREMIARRAEPGFEGRGPGGLPGAWQQGLAQEICAELAISARAGDTLLATGYALARLPETAAALAAGVISGHKAAIIGEATGPLDDSQAAEADRRAAPKLAGKTPGQVRELIRRVVIAVDPDGARRRREEAQREHARVELWQDEVNGTANLAGFGLPSDEALMADQRIRDRALAYKNARIFPGASMDLLRVRAYIDILLGRDTRGTAGGAGTGDATCQDGTRGHEGEDGDSGNGGAHPGTGGSGAPGGGTAAGGSGAPGGGTAAGGAGAASGTGAGLAANVNLTIPLATLLGLGERPGHLAGLGAIDPALARDMAAAAARSNRSAWCVTVTDDQGRAIGHGCACPARGIRGKRGARENPGSGGARTRDGPAFTRQDDEGPPGGYGTWTLTTTGGSELTVSLGPIPVTSCDHRYESAGYQPSGLLRHLVQIRDGTCTFPPCRCPARNCDFEHATPYHRGGRTDLCNCGPRCRRDHRVKQSAGWSVTQNMPGWHEWRTPAGRRYVSGPTEHTI